MGTAQASDYLENLWIDHLFRSATWAKPTALWVGLFTAAPSDAGGGTEVSGGSYARVNLPPLDANWAAPSAGNGVTSNLAAITFAAPTGAWGTVTHFGIFDASTGGNLLIWDALTSSVAVTSGGPAATFAVGALQITVG